MTLRDKLKDKWGIETEGQFWKIMLLFCLTGTSTIWLRKFLFLKMHINEATPGLTWWTAWLLVILPSYQVLLLVWGKVLGLFPFACWFEKKMLFHLGVYRKPVGPPPRPSQG